MMSKRHFSHKVYFALFSQHILKYELWRTLNKRFSVHGLAISSGLMLNLMLLCIIIDEKNHENNCNY